MVLLLLGLGLLSYLTGDLPAMVVIFVMVILGAVLRFVPPRYWLYLAIMLLGYAILSQVVKTCLSAGLENDGGSRRMPP